jgi:hypothetical protein
MRDMSNDNPPFKEFRKYRDAANDAVEKAWKFPYPAAADALAAEAVARAHSEDGKKGVEVRRKNLKTTPHAEEALNLIKTRRLRPKKSSTHNISTDLAKKFGASYKTWERFIDDSEVEGVVPKQLKT